MFTVELAFHGDLVRFLHRELRAVRLVRRGLKERTSVKDVIEACGVPHPKADLIIDASGGEVRAVDFPWPVQSPVLLETHPVPVPPDVLPSAPWLQTRHWTRFVADGHLGKLARNLRLLGLDIAYERDANDRRLLEIMVAEKRALLTRDRRLLMHSVVRHGYCHARQMRRGRLAKCSSATTQQLAPYSRCLRRNRFVDPACERTSSHRLPPSR